MEKIELTIDNKKIEVDKGTTVLKAARQAGIDIPTVAKWLGHRDGGALAMKVYGHLRDEHSKEAARKLTF